MGSRDIIQVSRTVAKGAELLMERALGSGEALGRVMPCVHHSLHPREEAGLFCPGHSPVLSTKNGSGTNAGLMVSPAELIVVSTPWGWEGLLN